MTVSAGDGSPGYRYWLLTGRPRPLLGPYSQRPWPAGWVAARCDASAGHRPPAPGCRCGIAVLPSLGDAAVALAAHLAVDAAFTRATSIPVSPRLELAPVIGRVATAGEWLPDPTHPGHVWRTAAALITELWLPARLGGHAERLAAEYRAPVHVSDAADVTAWTRELGPGIDPAARWGCYRCKRPDGYPVCRACRAAHWPSKLEVIAARMQGAELVGSLGYAFDDDLTARQLDPARIRCAGCGTAHWGRRGAAGLLLVGAGGRVLLARRAPGTDHAGTWGLPGGALGDGESAWDAAIRETAEEVCPGLRAEHLRLRHTHVDDAHDGGWSYTTFVVEHVEGPGGHPPPELRPRSETTAIEWVAPGELGSRRLHPGLRRALPSLFDHRGQDPGPEADISPRALPEPARTIPNGA